MHAFLSGTMGCILYRCRLLYDHPLMSTCNVCVHPHNGLRAGATVAINDLLLQSHGGRMRFFPAWNATALGAASFTTLRSYGAFLVSAAVDASGIVAPISIGHGPGGDVVFESPWTGAAAPKVASEVRPFCSARFQSRFQSRFC